MEAIEEIQKRHSQRAAFYVVYIREAHPTDGWRMKSNDRAGVQFARHRTFADRREAAQGLCARNKVGLPVLLDLMGDAAAEAYSAFPDRLYVIDRYGRVAYKGGRGPMGFDAQEMERALILVLLEQRLRML